MESSYKKVRRYYKNNILINKVFIAALELLYYVVISRTKSMVSRYSKCIENIIPQYNSLHYERRNINSIIPYYTLVTYIFQIIRAIIHWGLLNCVEFLFVDVKYRIYVVSYLFIFNKISFEIYNI